MFQHDHTAKKAPKSDKLNYVRDLSKGRQVNTFIKFTYFINI